MTRQRAILLVQCSHARVIIVITAAVLFKLRTVLWSNGTSHFVGFMQRVHDIESKMWSMFRNLYSWMAREEKTVVKYYDGLETPLKDIEYQLVKFSGGSVDLELNDTGIATLCINHYEKRNAISGAMMVDLRRAVERLERWREGKAVLMFGVQGTFCSGGDLNMARRMATPEQGFHMATYMHHVLRRFENLPLLTAALIEGSALGGGAELALACDFRLMAANAKGLGLVHSRMGIAPAWGGAARLCRLVGRPAALDLLASARVVAPADALADGLVDCVLHGGDAKEEAMGWLGERTRAAPDVIHALKAMCVSATATDPDDRTDGVVKDEKRIFAPLWGGPSNLRALAQNIRHHH